MSKQVAARRSWLLTLVLYGKDRLAALGLTLLLGFASAAVALYLFAELAEHVIGEQTYLLDSAVLAWLRQFASPSLDLLMRALSVLGSEAVPVLLLGLMVYFGRQRRWGAVAALLVATAGSQVLNDVLKDLFQRTRPAPLLGLTPAQSFSFPSGHAMVSASFYLFVAYLVWRSGRAWPRLLLSAILLLLIIGIGLSRLYLGVHYLTDVVAGYIAGFLWADAVIIGWRLLVRRRGVSDRVRAIDHQVLTK
jgi:undecaprenyl-diphosphatase